MIDANELAGLVRDMRLAQVEFFRAQREGSAWRGGTCGSPRTGASSGRGCTDNSQRINHR